MGLAEWIIDDTCIVLYVNLVLRFLFEWCLDQMNKCLSQADRSKWNITPSVNDFSPKILIFLYIYDIFP